ncbi:putative Mitochondrial processing peptidase [Candidatus Sulfopaludibacter sp. SbA3]|nr:putative Mitochondrial processing peptidase [Candidatus Sulfopaludibacter sp. SbA3]
MPDTGGSPHRLGAGSAWAQAPQAPPAAKKEAFLNKAPVSKEVLKVKLPAAYEAHLDNGLTILILENHRLPQISMTLQIRGMGGIFDPPGMNGLAGITAQMMREGTATRTSKQIAEDVDRLAASVGASAATDSQFGDVFISGLTDNFADWFGLGTDVLLHPSFPAEEWAKLKQRQLVGLKQQRTSASFLASERFSKAVYGDFPASVISATPASIEAVTPEAMKKFYAEHYVPQNATLGIAGDVTPAEIMPKLKAALGGWKKTEWTPKLPTDPTPAAGPRVLLVNRPGSVQTNLVMGNIAINRTSPDYCAFVVLHQVLGSNPAARLFLNLREDKGYTYGAYSNFTANMFPGPWRANSEVRTDVTEGSMREFFNEFRRIRDEKVPVNELEEKKRAVVASFAFSLESPQSVLSLAITRKAYGLPADYWDTYPAKIAAVTADDLQRVAKKFLSLDNIQIVAVGDASKIKSVMEKYGKVTVFDTDGKTVE